MKMNGNKKILSCILSMMLIVAMAFALVGCGANSEAENQPAASTQTQEAVQTETAQDEDVQTEEAQTEAVSEETQAQETDSGEDVQADEQSSDVAEATVVGEGQTQFTFVVADKDGNEKNFEIHTDKETVGEALLEVELIAGEEGDYGLYVKTVDGMTADYDVDQTYWAFYINGEYASTGVDATKVEEGATYMFKIEK